MVEGSQSLWSWAKTGSRSVRDLRFGCVKAENGAVKTRAFITALAVAILCVPVGVHPQSKPTPHVVASAEERVDINHATLEELVKVPGMTPSCAGRIVRFRPYHAKSDLLDRGVVSSEVYRRIKDYVIAHRENQ